MHNIKPLITEKEIAQLFARPSRWHSIYGSIRRMGREIVIMGVVLIVAFSLVNWPAVSSNLRYWWRVEFRNQNYQQSNINQEPKNVPVAESAPSQETILTIPKIDVKAPILWDIPYTQIYSELRNGVVHYANTAHPGEVGNTFLVGHSSDYVWSDGKYKQVFSLLDKLVAGDRLTVTYQGKLYTYEVVDAVVVKPTDTYVLNPTPTPILSLMTCYPVGTTRSRLVVQAKLITPTVDQPSTARPQVFPLPTVR